MKKRPDQPFVSVIRNSKIAAQINKMFSFWKLSTVSKSEPLANSMQSRKKALRAQGKKVTSKMIRHGIWN